MGLVFFGRPVAVLLVLPAIVLVLTGLYAGGPITDRIFGHPVLLFLGEISYSMYMIHTFVQLSWNQVLRGRVVEGPLFGVAALGAMIGLTVAAASVAHRYLEVPARRGIVGRFGRVATTA